MLSFRDVYNQGLVYSVVFFVLLSPAGIRTTEVRTQQPTTMQDRADEDIASALGSPDVGEATRAVFESVRRGERMIPHLLRLKGRGEAFRGEVLGHPNSSQLTFQPTGDEERDKGQVITLEVTALYLICAIYHGNQYFAQSAYLTNLSKPPVRRKTFNSAKLISKAWRSTMEWAAQLKKVGLKSLRSSKQDPLSGSGVAFW